MEAIALAISLLFGQLGAYSPIPGVYIYLHDIVIGIIILNSFYRHRELRFIPRLRSGQANYGLRLPILAFLVSCFLSLAINAHRLDGMEIAKSILYIARWGYYALLYVVVAQEKKPMQWLKALFATGVGFGVLGLVQLFFYPDLRNLAYLGWDPHFYRAFSTLLDPNFTGIMLVLTLFLGWGVWGSKRSWWTRGGLLVVAVAFILTFSRSSVLGLLAGLAVWTVYTKKYVLFWAGALVLIVAIVTPKPGGDNLSFFRKDSSLARVLNWQQGVQLVTQAPIVGHGFYALPIDLVLQTEGNTSIVTRAAAYLDNSLLFVFASTGIVGLAAYLWLLRGQERVIVSVKKKYPQFTLVGLASMAALIVHSMFINSLFYAWTMIWVWVLLGGIQSLYYEKKR